MIVCRWIRGLGRRICNFIFTIFTNLAVIDLCPKISLGWSEGLIIYMSDFTVLCFGFKLSLIKEMAR